MAEKNSIQAVLTIAERGRGKHLAKWYTEQGVYFSFQCRGQGTASSELLDVLGVGSPEKDILISLTGAVLAGRLLEKIEETDMRKWGSGIVCSVPVTGLNSTIATIFLHEQDGRTGGNNMDEHKENSLILIAVNQGHTDDVMEEKPAPEAAPLSAPDGREQRMTGSSMAFPCSPKRRLLP
jgi:hypothetical protein